MSAVDGFVSASSNKTEGDNRLRVLVVSHTYVVGVNQGKLDAIAKTGNAIVGLLAPSNWKALEWNRLLPLETPYSNIKIYAAPVSLTGRGGAHFYAPWKIWQTLHDFQPDIVHVEEEVFSLCAFELAIWSRLTGKPLSLFGWENMDRQFSALRHWVRQFVLDTASLVVAGNHDGAKLLPQWGYKGLVAVVPQIGVDPTLFHPQVVDRQNAEFQIGFLGRLVPEKGIDILFAAVQQLRKRGLQCRLILCGSGSSEADLRQEAQKQQIDDWVTWRGSVRHEDAPTEISKFDVLVLPSRTIISWKEQFGHVLIEAMAMGIPVIGSTCGEIPNVIEQADLVFQEDDVVGLAAILERMICDPEWRQAAGASGMQRVQQHYTHERIAEQLLDLWQTVLKHKSNARTVNQKPLKDEVTKCV